MTIPTAGEPPNADASDIDARAKDVIWRTRRDGLVHAKSLATAAADSARATAIQAEIDAMDADGQP